MPPEELRAALRRQPFVPFQIHLVDGRTFAVPHPDMAIVMSRTLVLGVYDASTQGEYPVRTEHIALIHIVSVAPAEQHA